MDFYGDSPTKAFEEGPNEGSIAETLVVLYGSPTSTLLVAETDSGEIVGTTAGVLFPLWCNKEHITGQEMFWYVDPAHRRTRAGGLLFKALEEWAKGAGARSFSMSSIASKHQKRVNQVYEKRGYTAMETTFIKEL